MKLEAPRVVTVTLNPAIDHTVSISNFQVDQVNRVESESQSAGGKGINVATFLAVLGERGTVTGWLGKENDSIFVNHFKRFGLEDQCLRYDGPTRSNIKIVDPANRSMTDINLPGISVSSITRAAFEKQLLELAARHEWFVLSGSLPPGASPGYYASLMRQLSQHRRRVILDTSGAPLRFGVEAGPFAIKPNLSELEELCGKTLANAHEIVAAARKLLNQSLRWVIVSRGPAPACFVSSDEAWLVGSRNPVDVKNTVGAGDAVVAGFLAGLLRAVPIESAMRSAVGLAHTVVSRPRDSIPDRASVAAWTERVVCERLP